MEVREEECELLEKDIYTNPVVFSCEDTLTRLAQSHCVESFRGQEIRLCNTISDSIRELIRYS